ncbi:Rne/Rng family ribonuclease [Stappia sp.]|uniref:ribonuclease E/G n=1 Tax=Stappia sp. TaxID=1870903 RepID=UPI0032D959A5
MANKMLIDAAHPEETRVVVVRGNRVEEFDFEAANRKQLRGNIYLAKVTRVEPSLQAAFVDYGGNRHGFLAFGEIHPDYYQIPVADRQALLEEEEAEARSNDSDEAAEKPAKPKRRRGRAAKAETEDASVASEESGEASGDADGNGDADNGDSDNGDTDVESVGAEDALEEVPQRARRQRKQYKIQEVIKRRQILLVQVVKEERGNKGAALTTYLSLAGRYSVLMPNTARGGGISRKITNPTDRKRLKKIASELEVPQGMGVILRTAGASRTKAEIKRDFEYLMRLWENVRDLTLQSSAPYLVYEEGSLIKRSIRDLYNKDIDQVLVAGDEGYREAKDFMRMLMPSHAKNVQPYKDATPVFSRFMVESQLDAMFSPQVTLKSGGYIVINQTEALVAIDVNSGKSTREHNIEDTAVQTNLEAAEEVARQLRLRDLAGLIVIDFIDMEENKNNRAVERKLKDCLKNDRARIQVGRISHFGLLEMSRQRIRTGVLESSMTPCPHCHGTGMIRSVESVALHVLRSLEDQLLKGATHNLIVRTTTDAALYILNQKRAHLSDLEARFGLEIDVQAGEMANGQHYTLEKGEPIARDEDGLPLVQPSSVTPLIVGEDAPEPNERSEERADDRRSETSDEEDAGNRNKRRRRRRRKKPGDEHHAAGDEAEENATTSQEDDETGAEARDGDADADGESEDEKSRRKRRRGRRGGRRSRRDGEGNGDTANADAQGEGDTGTDNAGDDTPDQRGEGDAGTGAPEVSASAEHEAPETRTPETEAPATASQEPASKDEPASEDASAGDPAAAETSFHEAPSGDVTAEEPAAEVADTPRAEQVPHQAEEAEGSGNVESAAETPDETAEAAPTEPESVETPEPETSDTAPEAPAEPVVVRETVTEEGDTRTEDDPEPKRSGWWQRRSFF